LAAKSKSSAAWRPANALRSIRRRRRGSAEVIVTTERLGLPGRIAAYFQSAQITPLLALVVLLLGVAAVLVTPREEEPQINVTMANVFIPFPGASVRDVEQMVSAPAEQVLSQITGVEHVMSISKPGAAVLAVQFKVGVPRTEALVRLHDAVSAHADWLPRGLGVGEPLIKSRGIDDVPIVALTLYAEDQAVGPQDLERVAHSLEIDLKRVPGTREVVTLGGPGRAALVELDPQRMASAGITVAELRQALQAANMGAPVGELLGGNRSVPVDAGPYLRDAREVGELVVGVRNGKPVFLQEVATVREGVPPAKRYVWHGVGNAHAAEYSAGAEPAEYPAVTIQISKKPGENAIAVADGVQRRVDELRNTVIPQGVKVVQSRNYGITANDKAQALIRKLLFATACVVALVFVTLGRREAAVVGAAVVLTLAGTLFASWAWGFTLNRVSLFALIFSIGILVDDAIVVVESIHRHLAMNASAQADLAAGQVKAADRPPRGRGRGRPEPKHPRRKDTAGGDPRRSGRGGRPDGAGHADGDRSVAADGLPQRPDRPLHESHPHQRQHGHAAVAGHRVQPHTLDGALVDEAGAGPQPPSRLQVRRVAGAPVRARVHAAARRSHGAAQPTPVGRGRGGADRGVVRLACDGPGHPEDAALRQQVGIPGGGGHACGHPAGADGGRAARARRLLGQRAGGEPLPGLCGHSFADQLQRPDAAIRAAQRRRGG
jgi:AcrB/AcrD/AcrF family